MFDVLERFEWRIFLARIPGRKIVGILRCEVECQQI